MKKTKLIRSTGGVSDEQVKQHPDGSCCKEGTRNVPRRFRACCEVFEGHVATRDYDVRYEWWPRQRVWVIAIPGGAGGGGIVINFCPHCGAELKPSRLTVTKAPHTSGKANR